MTGPAFVGAVGRGVLGTLFSRDVEARLERHTIEIAGGDGRRTIALAQIETARFGVYRHRGYRAYEMRLWERGAAGPLTLRAETAEGGAYRAFVTALEPALRRANPSAVLETGRTALAARAPIGLLAAAIVAFTISVATLAFADEPPAPPLYVGLGAGLAVTVFAFGARAHYLEQYPRAFHGAPPERALPPA